jgi:hypothetical protein
MLAVATMGGLIFAAAADSGRRLLTFFDALALMCILFTIVVAVSREEE